MSQSQFKQYLDAAGNLQALRKVAQQLTIQDLPDLDVLLAIISGGEKIDLRELARVLTRSVCGKRLDNSPAVKCQTCSNDLSSVICMECFEASRHAGHKFDYLIANGMCDCGYRCTITPSGFCSRHAGNHILRDFQREKSIFADLYVKKALFLLVSVVHVALLRMDREIYIAAYALLHGLVFEHQIDYLKNIYTKCLFINPRNGLADFDRFDDVCGHLLPYQNFAAIQKLELPHALALPSIYYLMHSEYYFPPSAWKADLLTKDFTEEQISEPLFRFLMIFGYYMRSTYLVKQLTQGFVGVSDAVDALQNGAVVTLPPDAQNNALDIEKVPWSDVPVQLYTDHFIDKNHACLGTAIEFLTHWAATAAIAGYSYEDAQYASTCRTSLIQMLQNDLECVDSRLYGQEIVQNMICSAVCAFERYLPMIPTYKGEKADLSRKLRSIVNYQYHAVFMCYSEKIPQYYQENLAARLPYFCHLMLMQPTALLEVPRFRERRVIGNDYNLRQAMNQHCNLFDINFNNLFGMYAGFLYQTKEDIYALDHDVVRCNDVLECGTECTVRDFHVQLIVYFLLQMARNPRFYFSYPEKCIFPQIPCGYAYHTQIPVVPSDQIFTEESTEGEPLMLVGNVFISALYIVLQAFYQYNAKSIEATAVFFRNAIDSPFVAQQSAFRPFPIIVSWALRQIVTVGLQEGKFFASLLAVNDYIKFAVFQNTNAHSFNYPHCALAVLQTSFFSAIDSSDYTAEQFLFEFLEHYGIVRPDSLDLYTPSKKEDPEKMLSLYQHAVRTLMQLVMRDQFCESCEELKMKYILAFLIFNDGQCLFSQFTKHFSGIAFFHAVLFKQKLREVTNRTENTARESCVYNTQQCTAINRLNSVGLKQMHLFDAFFSNIPMFLAEYGKNAALLNCSTLPSDTFSAPFNASAARFLFQSNTFIVLVYYLVTETFINPKVYQLKSNINEVYLLLALNQIIIHNPEHTALRKLLNAIPRDELQYSPAVWQVLTEISRCKIQTEQVTLKTRLNHLHQRLNIGSDQELRQVTETPESAFTEDALQTLQYLEDTNQYQTNCAICMAKDFDATLQVFCTPRKLRCGDRTLFAWQTCTHMFHTDCIETNNENDYYQCAICRLYQPMTLPLFYSDNIFENYEAVVQFVRQFSGFASEKANSLLQLLDICDRETLEFDTSGVLQEFQMFFSDLFTDQLDFFAFMGSSENAYRQNHGKQCMLIAYALYSAWHCVCEYSGTETSYLCEDEKYRPVESLFAKMLKFAPKLNPDTYNAHMDLIRCSGKYRYLDTSMSFSDFTFVVTVSQTLKAIFAGAELIYPAPLQEKRVKVAKMPQYYTDFIREQLPCCMCKKCSCTLCVFCGTRFCSEHGKDALNHADTCLNGRWQSCIYVFNVNVIFYRLFGNVYYFTGGPYLSDEGEDDCERKKRIPLYFNDTLHNNLENMLENANTQIGMQFVLRSQRILELMQSWSKQDDD